MRGQKIKNAGCQRGFRGLKVRMTANLSVFIQLGTEKESRGAEREEDRRTSGVG